MTARSRAVIASPSCEKKFRKSSGKEALSPTGEVRVGEFFGNRSDLILILHDFDR